MCSRVEETVFDEISRVLDIIKSPELNAVTEFVAQKSEEVIIDFLSSNEDEGDSSSIVDDNNDNDDSE